MSAAPCCLSPGSRVRTRSQCLRSLASAAVSGKRFGAVLLCGQKARQMIGLEVGCLLAAASVANRLARGSCRRGFIRSLRCLASLRRLAVLPLTCHDACFRADLSCEPSAPIRIASDYSLRPSNLTTAAQSRHSLCRAGQALCVASASRAWLKCARRAGVCTAFSPCSHLPRRDGAPSATARKNSIASLESSLRCFLLPQCCA